MNAALASVVVLVATLLVFLLGAGEDWGGLFALVLVAMGALSLTLAAVAIVGAMRPSDLRGGRRLMIAVVALPALLVFTLAVVAFVNSFRSFN